MRAGAGKYKLWALAVRYKFGAGAVKYKMGPGAGGRGPGNTNTQETNWSISKGMCVLFFDVFNGCSLVKKQIG